MPDARVIDQRVDILFVHAWLEKCSFHDLSKHFTMSGIVSGLEWILLTDITNTSEMKEQQLLLHKIIIRIDDGVKFVIIIRRIITSL